MKNKGFTLIEVLTALAIMSLVIIAVTGFMNTGIKTSSRANVETNLQKEAQTGLNQVTDWLMSSNHGIAVYGSSTYYDQAVCIFHDGENSTDQYVQVLYYRKADSRVYYDIKRISSTFQGTELQIQNEAAAITDWSEHLFCEYVKEFNLDISNISKKFVELKLVLSLQNIEYNQQPKKIMLRNEPVTNPTDYK